MAKTWTREELTNLSKEQLNALTQEEQLEARKQGRAFLMADLNIL
jgi:hypothetical protein